MNATPHADDAGEPLPCPFCGSDDVQEGMACHEWWVVCDDCGASTKLAESQDLARQWWNRRAPTTPPAAQWPPIDPEADRVATDLANQARASRTQRPIVPTSAESLRRALRAIASSADLAELRSRCTDADLLAIIDRIQPPATGAEGDLDDTNAQLSESACGDSDREAAIEAAYMSGPMFRAEAAKVVDAVLAVLRERGWVPLDVALCPPQPQPAVVTEEQVTQVLNDIRPYYCNREGMKLALERFLAAALGVGK